MKQYNAGAVSEYKVEGLRSNARYYARLYAYDPVKKLKSPPTQSIAVKTKRSGDDYDSDVDIDDVISGDIVVKDTAVVRGVWTVRITGANADRFVEQVGGDRTLDYFLDVRKPPSKAQRVNVLISVRVYEALTDLKENLIVVTEGSRLVIRPNTITRSMAGRQGDFNYELGILFNDTPENASVKNINIKSQITGIQLSVSDGTNPVPVSRFNMPLKVIIPYTDKAWYREGVTSGIAYDAGSSAWDRLHTRAAYDADSSSGHLEFELASPSRIAVADRGSDFFDDIYGNRYEDSINNVAAVHKLKSVSGRSFNPNGRAGLGDAVKLVLDIMDYSYGSNYMSTAVKSGLIQSADQKSASSSCTREKAIVMIMRAYEIKTGETAAPSDGYSDMYSDMQDVGTSSLSKVRFAVENGLAVSQSSDRLGPKSYITRAEFMAMAERMLVLAGEVD
jgi:hypothetical protein